MKEYILKQMTTKEQEKWMMILQDLQDKVSKPSYDTWIKSSIILLDEEQKAIRVYCQNSFVVDWIRNTYKQIIIDSVKTTFEIDILHFECDLYDEFKQGDK